MITPPPAGWLPAATALIAAAPSAWLAARVAAGYAAPVRLSSVLVWGGALTTATIFTAPSAPMLAASLLLGWTLLTLAIVDARRFRLPDALTLPLSLAGIAVAWVAEGDLPLDRLIGAVVGWSVLAAIAWLYRRARAREGLGMGDAKLLAAGGAWLGWAPLPLVLLLASLAGLAWVGTQALRGRPVDGATPIAFGVPLCLAIWLVWLWLLSTG